MLVDLVATGLVQAGTSLGFGHLLRLPGALPLPTARWVRQALQAHERLKALIFGAELLGPAAGLFVSSLANQVVQGLALASQDSPAVRLPRTTSGAFEAAI